MPTYDVRILSTHTCETRILNDADLRSADLQRADLIGATLNNTKFGEVRLHYTAFAHNDLSRIKGLEKCIHAGPSSIDTHTLMSSDALPQSFLRGCGLSGWEIQSTKLYDKALSPAQVADILDELHHLRTEQRIQLYSCFIS